MEDSREKQRKRGLKYYTAHRSLTIARVAEWQKQNPERSAYMKQKAGAKWRGIAFLLTFEEWWGIWQASGKWEERGKRKGQYVMARYGDMGPYATGNVFICTIGANTSTAHLGKIVSTLTRSRMSEVRLGQKRKPFTQEHHQRMSEAQTARWARYRAAHE